MQVILTQDVKKLGNKGDVINVAEGYGRNYLIPRGLAVAANEANMRSLQHEKSVKKEKVRKEEQEARQLAERLGQQSFTIKVKVGEGGRLFGSVTADTIAAAVQKASGIELDKRRLKLEDPIKNLGEYTISVKLYPGVAGEIKLKVESE